MEVLGFGIFKGELGEGGSGAWLLVGWGIINDVYRLYAIGTEVGVDLNLHLVFGSGERGKVRWGRIRRGGWRGTWPCRRRGCGRHRTPRREIKISDSLFLPALLKPNKSRTFKTPSPSRRAVGRLSQSKWKEGQSGSWAAPWLMRKLGPKGRPGGLLLLDDAGTKRASFVHPPENPPSREKDRRRRRKQR